MSEVKRFRADHRHVVETEFDDAQYVGVEDYDAKCHAAEVYFGSWKRTEEERDTAQSELAALREELALAKDTAASWKSSADGLAEEARDIDKSLTAAEQRNAGLIELLQECVNVVRFGEDFDLPVTTMDRIDEALAKPTESGASE